MGDPLRAFYTLAVLNPQEEDVLALRASHVDWDTLVNISFELNSSYIFYTNIKRFGLEACFSSTNIKRLQAKKESAILNNLTQINLFYEITGLLQAEGIKFIPLKGISLTTDTYPDIRMRVGSDLDIFIHPANIDKCVEALKKSSYKFEPFIPSSTRGVTSAHGQACMVRSQDDIYIDIHYRLFTWYEEKYIFKIDSAKFYENTVNKLWKGYDLAYMKKEDEFYYLLMCIFRNRLGAFRHYLDADAILKIHGENFDWTLVKSYLWKSPLKQYWETILKFMRERLKTPIPDEYDWERDIRRGNVDWVDFNKESQGKFFEELWACDSLEEGGVTTNGDGQFFLADGKKKIGHFIFNRSNCERRLFPTPPTG
ncbi:hypothetical protein LCGC14_1992480, partial [marine sediment metagenome]